jgi:hypothetical protein
VALAAIAVAGCGDSEERAPAPNPVEEAATEFARALESGDCKALADVVIHSSRRSGDLVNTQKPPSAQECRELAGFRRSFVGYRAGAAQRYGTGGVADAEVKGKPTSSVFVQDIDGSWVQFVTSTPPADHELGTRPADASRFDRNARDYLTALREGDCRTTFRLTNPDSPQLQQGRLGEQAYCKRISSAQRIPYGLPARLRRSGETTPTPLGKTERTALYEIRLPDGGRWTLVLAATDQRIPAGRKKGHDSRGVLDYLKANRDRRATD